MRCIIKQNAIRGTRLKVV
jgi:hypothetical protein